MAANPWDVFTREERAILKRAAVSDNRSVSNYIRNAVFLKLKADGFLPPEPPQFFTVHGEPVETQEHKPTEFK